MTNIGVTINNDLARICLQASVERQAHIRPRLRKPTKEFPRPSVLQLRLKSGNSQIKISPVTAVLTCL